AEDMVEAVSFLVDVHASGSLREILEVRRIFEAETAYRAASLIDETGLDELRATIAGTDQTSIESLVAQDYEFHSPIASYAGKDIVRNKRRRSRGEEAERAARYHLCARRW